MESDNTPAHTRTTPDRKRPPTDGPPVARARRAAPSGSRSPAPATETIDPRPQAAPCGASDPACADATPCGKLPAPATPPDPRGVPRHAARFRQTFPTASPLTLLQASGHTAPARSAPTQPPATSDISTAPARAPDPCRRQNPAHAPDPRTALPEI